MLAQKGPKGDLALAGEPTGLQVVTAHKGNLWLQLKTKGKSAHGSTPQHGRNAIEAMTPVLEFLFGEYPNDLKSRTHPLLGSPTLSVGKIRGGSQPSVVPNECVVDLDRRTIPGETEASVRKELIEAFKERSIPLPEFSKSRSVPCPPLDTDPNLPFCQSFLRAANKRKPRGVPYFTDASPIAMGGTPALVFGPGTSPKPTPRTNGWKWPKSTGLARSYRSFSNPCLERQGEDHFFICTTKGSQSA